MVTMRDVAELAGVSQATVSYALRGDSMISDSTRKKVESAARKLSYSANLSARSLRSGRSNAIGLILQDIVNPFSAKLTNAISQTAIRHGMQTVVQQTLYSEENEIAILKHVTSNFCDAIAFTPSKITEKQVRAQLKGKPAVLFTPGDMFPTFDTMETPCWEGAFTAASYLLSTGCRNLRFVGLPYQPYELIKDSQDSGLQRLVGFQYALIKNRITPESSHCIGASHWSFPDSRDAVLTAIDGGDQFDGLVCVNDAVAMGVLRALALRGISVPGDVSVIGFDGIDEAEYLSPSLTTIALDFDDMAQRTVDTLLTRLNGSTETSGDGADTDGKPLAPQHMKTRFTLVRRDSTR